MVGEQAQEMQLAGWLPATRIPWLLGHVPSWMSLWFAIFPTWETLLSQALAITIVLSSYRLAERKRLARPGEALPSSLSQRTLKHSGH